jgi:thioredoxin 1
VTRADWYDVAFIAAIFAVVLAFCAVFGCPKCEAAGPEYSDRFTNSGRPVLQVFTATWCGPCQGMKPVYEQLRGEGYDVRITDVDENPQLAKGYRASRLPCVVCVVYRNNRWWELGRLQGTVTAGQLRRLCVIPKATQFGAKVRRFVEP